MGRILIRSLDLMKKLNFLQTENTILLLLPEIIFEKLQKFFFLGERKREKRKSCSHIWIWKRRIFHEVCGKFEREKKVREIWKFGRSFRAKASFARVTASDDDFLLAHTRHDTFETRWIVSIIDPRWNERTHTSVMESKYYHMTAAE